MAVSPRHRGKCLGGIGAAVAGVGIGYGAPWLASDLQLLLWPLLAVMLFGRFSRMSAADLAPARAGRRFLAALAITHALVIPALVGLLLLPLQGPATTLHVTLAVLLLAPCTDRVVAYTNRGHGSAQQVTAAAPLVLLAQLPGVAVGVTLLLGPDVLAGLALDEIAVGLATVVLMPLGLALALDALPGAVPLTERLRRTGRRTAYPVLLAVLAIAGAHHGPQAAEAWPQLLVAAGVATGFLLMAPLAGWAVGRLCRLGAAGARSLVYSSGARNGIVILPVALLLPEPGVALGVLLVHGVIEIALMVGWTRIGPGLVPLQPESGKRG